MSENLSGAATVVDQPPPMKRPDRIPVWENVISDFRDRVADNFDDPVEDAQHKHVGDSVIADMLARDRIGRERYGTPLTTGNGRDHLVDAYQELLDGAVYLRAELLEGGGSTSASLSCAYHKILDTILDVRVLLDAREVSRIKVSSLDGSNGQQKATAIKEDHEQKEP